MMGVGSSIVYTFKKESVGPTLLTPLPPLITTTKTANTQNTTHLYSVHYLNKSQLLSLCLMTNPIPIPMPQFQFVVALTTHQQHSSTWLSNNNSGSGSL